MIDSGALLKAVRPRLRRWVAEAGDDVIVLLRRLTGFTNETIGGWLASETPPAQPLIKIWHLLDMVGFDSPEMADLDDLQHLLGGLYAVGLIDNEKLLEILKVRNVQTVVQILRGQTSANFDMDDLEALQEQYKEALAAKVAGLPRYVAGPIVTAATAPTAPAPELAEVSDETNADGTPNGGVADVQGLLGFHDPALTLSILLGVVAPLARRLVLEGDAADRARFRTLVGLPGVALLPDAVDLLQALRTRATYEEYMKDHT